MRNIWKDGIMGVVTGDALGTPVQFTDRAERDKDPIETMQGHGTFDLPAGTWSDDSSLTLALASSITEQKQIDLQDIMLRFTAWLAKGAYTPFGYAFDIGNGTLKAIRKFIETGDVYHCGGSEENNNGNGSLMRILPACLFCIRKNLPDQQAVYLIHQVSALTHRHIRAEMACGLYYFLAKAVLEEEGTLLQRLQKGMDHGWSYYALQDTRELSVYKRLRDLNTFAKTDRSFLESTGYVVDSLEAAIWSLITTDTLRDALLKAVNLGGDTDTISAIAGGIAGLYYGFEAIPHEWIDVLQRREWLIEICEAVNQSTM